MFETDGDRHNERVVGDYLVKEFGGAFIHAPKYNTGWDIELNGDKIEIRVRVFPTSNMIERRERYLYVDALKMDLMKKESVKFINVIRGFYDSDEAHLWELDFDLPDVVDFRMDERESRIRKGRKGGDEQKQLKVPFSYFKTIMGKDRLPLTIPTKYIVWREPYQDRTSNWDSVVELYNDEQKELREGS